MMLLVKMIIMITMMIETKIISIIILIMIKIMMITYIILLLHYWNIDDNDKDTNRTNNNKANNNDIIANYDKDCNTEIDESDDDNDLNFLLINSASFYCRIKGNMYQECFFISVSYQTFDNYFHLYFFLDTYFI